MVGLLDAFFIGISLDAWLVGWSDCWLLLSFFASLVSMSVDWSVGWLVGMFLNWLV